MEETLDIFDRIEHDGALGYIRMRDPDGDTSDLVAMLDDGSVVEINAETKKIEVSFDSWQDTINHIQLVQRKLYDFIGEIAIRAKNHDASKLVDPEKRYFDQYTPLLEFLKYGTKEYRESLFRMTPALSHHYSVNRHHPEFFPGGIDDMNLIDVLEMFADWVSAAKRHKDGDVLRSLEINKARFGICDQLYSILKNTISYE